MNRHARVRPESPVARRAVRGALGLVAAGIVIVALAPPAAAQGYTFVKVADSADDGFDPIGFGCPAINSGGDIGFKADRIDPAAPRLIRGVYRANAAGLERLTTIAEFGGSFDFVDENTSISDTGQIAFAVRQDTRKGGQTSSIIRAGSTDRKDTTVLAEASTTGGLFPDTKKFNRIGFQPSVNDSDVVALKAETDTVDTFDFADGLFSGATKKLTTRYLSTGTQFSEFGTFSRPTINNAGDIAFEAWTDPDAVPGIFVSTGSGFTTIAAPDPNVNPGAPSFNDAGTVVFHRIFNDRGGEELVSGNGGPLTVIADTDGPFASLGTPALNNDGDVAFVADLDSGGSGVFLGPDPVADKVIATGDVLDGSPVAGVVLCQEGLNDSGELAIQVRFGDPFTPDRTAIYRATPTP